MITEKRKSEILLKIDIIEGNLIKLKNDIDILRRKDDKESVDLIKKKQREFVTLSNKRQWWIDQKNEVGKILVTGVPKLIVEKLDEESAKHKSRNVLINKILNQFYINAIKKEV